MQPYADKVNGLCIFNYRHRTFFVRQDIGIHSDVITDAIIPLLERGILTGRRKSSQRGKIVTSFAMGSRRLYDLIDRNPLFSFLPIEVVCNAATIAAQVEFLPVIKKAGIYAG